MDEARMSVRARAAMGERDANHSEIEGYYREQMCLVWDCSFMGNGFPDMLVRVPTKMGQILALVEVKTAEGVLSPSQLRFIRDWGVSTVTIVRNREDVNAHVERVRTKFK